MDFYKSGEYSHYNSLSLSNIYCSYAEKPKPIPLEYQWNGQDLRDLDIDYLENIVRYAKYRVRHHDKLPTIRKVLMKKYKKYLSYNQEIPFE